MRTSRSSTVREGSLSQRPPWTETPSGQRPLPPGQRPPPDRDPPAQKPLDRDLPWTETPPTLNRITDRYKNITFPQLLWRAVKNYPEKQDILYSWYVVVAYFIQ